MKEGDESRPFTPVKPDTSSTPQIYEIITPLTEIGKKKNGKNKNENINKEKGVPEYEKLSISDKEILGKYINPTYLSHRAIYNINSKFCEDSSVQLRDFLRTDISESILKATMKADKDDLLGKKNVPVVFLFVSLLIFCPRIIFHIFNNITLHCITPNVFQIVFITVKMIINGNYYHPCISRNYTLHTSY